MVGLPVAAPDPGQETNYAPSKPLKDHVERDRKPKKAFVEWLRTMLTRLEEERRLEWMELALVWELVNKFIEGKQMLRRRHRGFGWDVVPMPETTASMVREQNKIGFYSHTLISKWVSSRTRISAVPGDDSDESAGAARIAQRFYEALEPMVYDEVFRQTEALSGQIHGTYARYFYYDAEAEDGGFAERAVYGKQTIGSSEGIGECLSCGFVGTDSEFRSFISPSESASSPLEPSYQAAMSEEAPISPHEQELSSGIGASQITPDDLAEADTILQADSAIADQQDQSVVCPECGSPDVAIEPGEQAEVEVQTGTEKHKLGRIKCVSVPYSEIRHDFASSLRDSPWMRWRRRLRKEVVKFYYPNLDMPPADSLKYRDWGLDYEERMRRSTVVNYSGTSSDLDRNLDDQCDYTQWWLTPPMYADYIFPENIKTVAGETIPAGTKASKLFPDGMYIAMVEGIDAPLQIRNESHRKRWVAAPYHLRLFTGLGIGVQDAVEMQRQWNVILSLVFTHIRTTALPGWLYDKDAIEPDSVRKLGQAQMSIPASLRNRPEGTRIEQLVYQMPPGQIPSHIPWYVTQLDANMQTTMGALVNEGLPGVGSNTATGAEIFNSAANQHNAPQFALKAMCDVESAYIMLELAKAHYVDPRYLPLKGKNGTSDAIWFSAADICNGQIRLEAVPDSWLPRTRFDRQEMLQKLLLMFGGVPGLQQAMMAMPDFVAEVSEAFNVEIAGDVFTPTALLCRERVDQIKQIAPGYAQMFMQMQMMAQLGAPIIDPMSGIPSDPATVLGFEIAQQVQPPPCIEEPNHSFAVKWLRDSLLNDEFKQADELTRAGVKGLIRIHTQLMGQEQLVMQQMALMGAGAVQDEAQEQGLAPGSPEKTEQGKRRDTARANMGPKKRKDDIQRSTQQQEGRKG